MASPQQVRACQRAHEAWGYVQHHEYADRKLRQGHKQRLCAVCCRWKFASEQCGAFREALAGLEEA